MPDEMNRCQTCKMIHSRITLTSDIEEAIEAHTEAAVKPLKEALAGLYGLLQLFAARDDVPAEVAHFASNHRAEAARALLDTTKEQT